MTALPVLLCLASAALGQMDVDGGTEEGRTDPIAESSADAGTEQLPTAPTLNLDAQGRPPVEKPAANLPLMRFDLPISCGFLQPTPQVPSGHFRIQCDDTTRVCLVAPLRELTDEGVEGNEPLARVNECGVYPEDDFGGKYRREGYRFVPAIAEAPPGWVRDERGRVMQVNFDLHRRIYLGFEYAPIILPGTAPALVPSGTQDTTRFRTEFGIEVEFPGEDAEPTLHRLHLLQSEFFFDTYSAESTLVRYDYSVDRSAPFLRLTTFFGQPRRFDLNLDAAGYFEALHLEWLRRGGETSTFLTLGDAEVTFDLWHSKDLVSYVRLRGGAAAEQDVLRKFLTLKPVAAVEGDFTLDQDGFHHLSFQVQGEKLLFDKAVLGRTLNPQRLRARAAYEVIFIAINDQPLTLYLDARATYRDDLPTQPAGWEYQGGAGLRFSFWAPARRSARLQAGQ